MKIKITPGLILAALVLFLVVSISVMSLFVRWLKTLDTVWASVVFSVFMLGVFIIDFFQKKLKAKRSGTFLDAAAYILGSYADEFKGFYRLYMSHKKTFLTQNDSFLNSHNNFDANNLEPIELLYLFASSKNLVFITDWKGEENEHEIEIFLETLVPKPVWKNSSDVRNKSDKPKGDNYTVRLLKSIDKDLRAIDRCLIFFDLSWDAYVYTCIDTKACESAVGKAPDVFYNAKKLR